MPSKHLAKPNVNIFLLLFAAGPPLSTLIRDSSLSKCKNIFPFQAVCLQTFTRVVWNTCTPWIHRADFYFISHCSKNHTQYKSDHLNFFFFFFGGECLVEDSSVKNSSITLPFPKTHSYFTLSSGQPHLPKVRKSPGQPASSNGMLCALHPCISQSR